MIDTRLETARLESGRMMVRSKATHASVSTTSTLGGLMVRNRPKLVVRPVRGVSCGFRLERSCFTSAVQASTRRALVAVPDDRPERGCNLAKDASATPSSHPQRSQAHLCSLHRPPEAAAMLRRAGQRVASSTTCSCASRGAAAPRVAAARSFSLSRSHRRSRCRARSARA